VKRVKVSSSLDFQFADHFILQALADRLSLDFPSGQKEGGLADLLNRLFYAVTSIVISPVAVAHGSACLVKVQPIVLCAAVLDP
jgi:hypothetical protein